MKVFIVHAHPEPRSFNAALTRRAAEVLGAEGHTVEVSDLYAMRFKAVADADDFTGDHADPDYLRIDHEQTHAHERGTIAADIRAEQAKLHQADLLILQFPMWWFGMPAILKGWADRVFTRGFAYLPGRKYDTGLMRGKLAMVSVTTGTSAETYAPDGIDGALLDVLWPVHNGLLRYSGFDILTPFVTYMPRRLSAREREDALEQYETRLRDLSSVSRLFFHPAEDYGPAERLLPGIKARSGFQHNEVADEDSLRGHQS
ncbi:NAD(P)H-dependent oxidoreductase [Nonomuraea sp. NPDC026600]|uniref:NAD(P)H-dependent oxidoreductase n=1 Tax=Nonomuraea sp. NPDC026600 TaxID=3155363 RepID=UPI0033D343B0